MQQVLRINKKGSRIARRQSGTCLFRFFASLISMVNYDSV
ncbi:hypothetical protein ALO_01574 [Acetonema longum DSM 6540]|uniref:Uncharacterized protein n=1 Tax=Acetonema longum DSM 6540 TaxID=1009370 RepID=F7NE52_9FIRM|nr:hypothetical protein ALO_01574 [Acetonema longum DSM 6540]